MDFLGAVWFEILADVRKNEEKEVFFSVLVLERRNTMKYSKIFWNQVGKIGYILLWLLGVPIPILIVIYLVRGCT